MTIDIEQARTNAIQMYAHLNDGKFADNLSYVMKAITELERLQKFNDVIAIIESGYKAIESGEAFEHGFPESRLIPSNWNDMCLKAVLDEVIEKITPLIKEYLQDELTYQEVINDRD